MQFRFTFALASAFVIVLAICDSVLAQSDPWVTYADSASDSRCALVNASNAELVVSAATGQLILVSGTDVTLQDTLVDADGFVFFEGQPFGLIGFAEDGDGFRTLWWLTLTGTTVEVDPITAVPSASLDTPADFADVSCDACDFWDDQSICVPPPITVPLCGIDVPVALPMIVLGLGIMGFVQRGGCRGLGGGA